MRIISTNVELAGSKLECSFEGGLHSSELTPSHEWAEVVHTGLDLPAGVYAREALLPIDLHQSEVPERFHPSVTLRKMASTFQVERECCLKRGKRSDVFNPACDLTQIQIFHSFGMRSEESFHSLCQIAGFVQNDELSMDIENLIDGGSFRKRGKGYFQKRRFDVWNGLEFEVHMRAAAERAFSCR